MRFRPALLLFAILLAPVAQAQQWEAIHPGFGIAGTLGPGNAYAVNLTTSDGTFLYAIVAHFAEQRVRLFRSPDQGTTWQERPAYAAAGGSLANVFRAESGRLYAVNQSGGGVVYSSDQGTTWTNAAAGTTNGSAMARVGQKVVVARGFNALRVSSDAGATWADGPSPGLNSVTDNERVFIGIDFAARLTRSADGGATWMPISIPGVFAFVHVWNVGATLYAKSVGNSGEAGLIFTSTDDGATWAAAPTFDRTAFAYAYPVVGRTWLLNDAPASGGALFKTTDGAATATNITLNYPRVVGSPNTLCTSNFSTTTDYAIGNAYLCSTQPNNAGGVGLYRFRMTSGVASAPAPGAPALALTLSPNPVAARLTVQAAGLGGASARLTLYDARGRTVAVLHDGPTPDPLAVSVEVSGLGAGVYLVRLSTQGTVVTRPVVVR